MCPKTCQCPDLVMAQPGFLADLGNGHVVADQLQRLLNHALSCQPFDIGLDGFDMARDFLLTCGLGAGVTGQKRLCLRAASIQQAENAVQRFTVVGPVLAAEFLPAQQTDRLQAQGWQQP